MLFNYEKELLDKNIALIAGVDEVGRGPLAGPMVVCAVILDSKKINNLTNNDVSSPELELYCQINDSKKLSPKTRSKLSDFITNVSICYSLIEISNTEIDSAGIGPCTQKAFYNAVHDLKVKPQYVLTDSFPIKCMPKDSQSNIIKGDSLSISIAAASIVAKVYRDNLMDNMHTKYPQYGFCQHKGYGTVKHMAALKQYGPCESHRRSFEPVKSMFN
jgi:ribonuclease HII